MWAERMRNQARKHVPVCPEEGRAPAYVTGEMSEGERRQFEAHLADCPMCLEELERTRSVIEILRSLPAVAASRDLAPEILMRVREKRPVVVLPLLAHPVAVAAAVLLLLGGAWLWYLARGGPGAKQRRIGPGLDSAVQARTRAAEWLCRTQERDGSWRAEKWGGDKRYDVALSSLAVMAIASELSNVPAGRECVRRGVEYLLGSQSATGEFGPSFGGGAYNHALATLALLHVFEMDRDERLRRALDRALHVILGRQTRKGGWGYWGEPEGEPNLSVTMWQLEALRLAESLGWPDVHDNVRRGVLWVASVADDRGLFGYRSAADFPPGGQSLTLMGALALMSGTESVLPSGQMQRVRQRIREAAVQTGGEPDFYHAYFLAAVIKKMEDEAASRAFAGIRRNILASQRRQGANSGSWDPDRRWGNVGGRIYATAMASLSLR